MHVDLTLLCRPTAGSSRDAFILQNCAPRNPSERHSSGEDPGAGADAGLEVDMQVEEPAEQPDATTAQTARCSPVPAAPPPSASQSTGGGAELRAAAGAAPAVYPQPGPSHRQQTSEDASHRHQSSEDASHRHQSSEDASPRHQTSEDAGRSGRSSGSSADRRPSAELPFAPLVPLTAQTPASVRPEELTHVVRVPESVASGEAALSWEPAQDPLGICFPREMLYDPPERGPTSPNISYCVLCWDGGDLLLCDSCERAFHRDCYVGPAGDDESEA